jgi:putative endonuclease
MCHPERSGVEGPAVLNVAGWLQPSFMSEEKLYYVYMVADRSRVLYVGFTSDLYQRMIQHRGGRFEGFTSQYRCDRLVWFESMEGHLTRSRGRSRSNVGAERRKSF